VFFLPDEAPQQTAEVIARAVAQGDLTTGRGHNEALAWMIYEKSVVAL